MKASGLKLFACVLIITVLFASCASILGRSSYPLAIKTEPRGARITITDKKGKEIYNGRSPAMVTLKSGAGFFSKAKYFVKITSSGYGEQILPVEFQLDGLYFGNLLLGGFIGMLIIDPATGAMWTIKTPGINVILDKNIVSNTEKTLQILDINEVSQDVKEQLVRVK